MILLTMMFLFLMIWLFFKFTGAMLKICYVLCIGLPLALTFAMLGSDWGLFGEMKQYKK